MTQPTVIKVGGSLFDLDDLGPRLRSLLNEVPTPVLLFPGGGPTADVIRKFDRIHRLGEEASHWLALMACTLNGHLLARLVPGVPVTADLNLGVPFAILDAYALARADEGQSDHLPHHWQVTSDSMAVRVAHRAGARELILLKSTDAVMTGNWSEAVARGLVDRYFPTAVEHAGHLPIRILNLRRFAARGRDS